MPKIRSLSEFNRNQNTLIAELKEMQEPIYLTKNGASSLVVMDAEAFDRAMSFRDEVHAREMRVYEGIMRGYEDFQQGRVEAADEADARIRKLKGWV
ncbi:MAG: type II toxin-antitoxin system prevent-host-death family antitoxin [Raoultibacter sp.]